MMCFKNDIDLQNVSLYISDVKFSFLSLFFLRRIARLLGCLSTIFQKQGFWARSKCSPVGTLFDELTLACYTDLRNNIHCLCLFILMPCTQVQKPESYNIINKTTFNCQYLLVCVTEQYVLIFLYSFMVCRHLLCF